MKKVFSLILVALIVFLTGCNGDKKNAANSSIDTSDPITSYSNACRNLYNVLFSNRVSCNVTGTITTATQNVNKTTISTGKMASDLTTDSFNFRADIDGYVLDEENSTAAKNVTSAIEALPDPEKVTSADKDKVSSVREEYSKLSAAGRYKVENYSKLTLIEEKLGISVEENQLIDGTSGQSAVYCDGTDYYIFNSVSTYKMPVVEGVKAEITKSLYFDLPVTESEVSSKSIKATDTGYSFKFTVTPGLVDENTGSTILSPFKIPFTSVSFTSVVIAGTIDSEGVIETYDITASGTISTSDNPVNFIIETSVAYEPLESSYVFEKPDLIASSTNIVDTTYEQLMNSSSSVSE